MRKTVKIRRNTGLEQSGSARLRDSGMRGRWAALLLVSPVALLSGCSQAAPQEDDLSGAVAQDPLWYRSAGRWLTTSEHPIPVCYDGGTDPSGGLTQQYIEQSWTRMAGIHFKDWGTCQTNHKGIGLSWDTKRAGTDNPTGRHSDGTTHITLNSTETGTRTRHVPIHEFGHALGFYHEHNRPDAPVCESCSPNEEPCTGDNQCKSGLCRAKPGSLLSTCAICADDQAVCDMTSLSCKQGEWDPKEPYATAYDPHSIMNYCADSPAGTSPTGLSPLDVLGARRTYGSYVPMRIGLAPDAPSRLSTNDLCLGVVGVDSHGNGARVEAYPCRPDASDLKWDQVWSFRATSGGYFRVVNVLHGYCLGVLGVNPPNNPGAASYGVGTALEVYNCDPNSSDAKTDEEWRYASAAHSDGVVLQNRATPQLYLGGDLQSGARLSMQSTGLRIRYYERPVTDVNYYAPNGIAINGPVVKLRNKLRDKYCLGVQGIDTPHAGSLAEVYTCEDLGDGTDARQDEDWIMEPTSGGYFQLKNAASLTSGSPLCLGVQGVDSVGIGARVEVYFCGPGAGDQRKDQEWTWSGDNLVNRRSVEKDSANPLCLGVLGRDDSNNGAGVEVYPCAPTADDEKRDQRWLTY